jgi:hypothetical protein
MGISISINSTVFPCLKVLNQISSSRIHEFLASIYLINYFIKIEEVDIKTNIFEPGHSLTPSLLPYQRHMI